MSSGGWGDVRRGVLSKWNSRIEINTESCLNKHTSAVDTWTSTTGPMNGKKHRKTVLDRLSEIYKQPWVSMGFCVNDWFSKKLYAAQLFSVLTVIRNVN